MITTKSIVLPENARDIFLRLDQELMFKFYIPGLIFNKRIVSPLRKDNSPSFSVFINRMGYPMYHDYATGESGDIIKFVMKLTGLNYHQTIKKIIQDIGGSSTYTAVKQPVEQPQGRQRRIKVIPRKYTPHDLMYWEQYGIRLPTLQKYRVYPLDCVYIDDVLVSEYRKNQPIYGYYLGDGWKIYKPFSAARFYMDSITLQGYNQLPPVGDLLIITKSMKDVMLLDSLGYTAIAPHGEAIRNITEMPELKCRFEKQLILFDNDQAGINGAMILSGIYDIPMVYIPVEEKVKDLSDYYKVNNFEKTDQLIKQLVCLKSEQSTPV